MGIGQATKATTGYSAWLNVHVWYWRILSLLVVSIVAIPILVVCWAWTTPSGEVWQHLANTVLTDIVVNTLLLIAGVGFGVFVLGVSLAWLTAMCDFPGRKIFDWALMLPLAVPAYVLAFVYVGLFDFSGPIQTGLRQMFGVKTLWLPQIRTPAGLVMVMVLAFYPYVYMLARSAFIRQGRTMLETGRILGLSPLQAFMRVTLPMARPVIAAGVALALMEALADFGAVAVFNFDTFTTGIYKAWFDLGNLPAAAQLASLLLLFVAVALTVEQRMRGKAQFHSEQKSRSQMRYRLRGKIAWFAAIFASLVLLMAFVLPLGQLLVWVWNNAAEDLNRRYVGFFANTLFLGATAAAITALIAVVIAYSKRLRPDMMMRTSVRIATLGYALPGSVLAVGIMLSFVWLDKQILVPVSEAMGFSPELILSSSLLALMMAYVVRFLAVAYGPVDSTFESIKPSILQAARSLGAGNWQILWRVSVPMLRPGIFTALLLVFVEVMKEMPATLLLRPFGWSTLATRIFEMTSEGEWERAALPSVTLIAAGLIPVILLVRRSAAGRH